MLQPEAARKQLEKWYVAGASEEEDEDQLKVRYLARAKTLPARLRTIAFNLLDRDAQGKEYKWDQWAKSSADRSTAAGQLDQLSRSQRVRLFKVFFPSMTEMVEETWQFLKRALYQDEYMSKPFRAPNLPAVSQGARTSWVASMIEVVCRFQEQVVQPAWLAAWAPYLDYASSELSGLLAATIDAGGAQGDEVFEILCQSARNEHEIGAMGEHVIASLLMASRPEGWSLIEKTLLAAQRQEGLRQVILESIPKAHPAAFRRMLALIGEHQLTRFSAVVRAVDGWFESRLETLSPKKIRQVLESLETMMANSKIRDQALAGDNPQAAYLALWSIAFDDAPSSIRPAQKLLGGPSAEMRYVAALHLSDIDLSQTRQTLLSALEDENLWVVRCALAGLERSNEDDFDLVDEKPSTRRGAQDDFFERLERLYARLPAKTFSLKPILWHSEEQKWDRQDVGETMINAIGDRSPTRLIPYLSTFNAANRERTADLLIGQKKWDTVTRETIITLAGDSASDVRGVAIKALSKRKLKAEEAPRLEAYLTRKTAGLRNDLIDLLLGQTDRQAVNGAERLLQAKNVNQRLAGLEMLRQLVESDRQVQACRELAEAYQDQHQRLSSTERTQLASILQQDRTGVSLENALGLMDPAKRTPVTPPKKHKIKFISSAAIACVKSLDDLIHQHRETRIQYKRWDNEQHEELLGNVDWEFPSPNCNKPPKSEAEKLPLRKVWEQWWKNRPASLRDSDGMELLRASVWFRYAADDWDRDELKRWAKGSDQRKKVLQTICGDLKPVKLRYEAVIREVLSWLLFLHPPKRMVDFLLDAMETSFALVPKEEHQKLVQANSTRSQDDEDEFDDDEEQQGWRDAQVFELWCEAFNEHEKKLNPQQSERCWRLLHWRDEPMAGASRERPNFSILAAAYQRGQANEHDLLDDLLGPRGSSQWGEHDFDSLSRLTRRKLREEDQKFLQSRPEAVEWIDHCRERILEIELARGEMATAATAPALAVDSYWGIETLMRLFRALGKQPFKIVSGWRSDVKQNRAAVITELISSTYPSADETAATFSVELNKTWKIIEAPQERILHLAFLAPQWAQFVEHDLKWLGLQEGLYWFLAHMSDAMGAVEHLLPEDDEEDQEEQQTPEEIESLSSWERLILERTPLTQEERFHGAVDVAWFQRTYAQLGPKRWQAMAEAARFAANASQARKAQFLADVLLGKAPRKELMAGIRRKHLKDHVRLLGLLPLAAGAKRYKDLAERYQVLQEYRRYANQLSSMTRPDALQACSVGMQNLAATAGYPDPLRLEWAMEAESVKDLAAGPVSHTKEGVTVTLKLDHQAKPQLTVLRGEKPLKSIPPKIKKDKKIAALAQRSTELRRQSSRIKQSLEGAMCRGDGFTGAELNQLCQHALLAPLLTRLVLVGEGIIGYPDKKGKALRDHAGKLEPVKKKERFRIAHCCDLYESGRWDEWQKECFRAERIQPFKQVFRELYVVTRQEKKDGAVSHRYAGQQVNPSQAYALWGQRGWQTSEGMFKTFHDVQLTASVSLDYGVTTPADVEGPVISTVTFRRRGEWAPVKLTEVPPRIFSEVMRDMDLVVSVAHAGGVDPEATASTVEMRANLLRETCQLLSLNNVRLQKAHALIRGKLSRYNVHLGSGVVHQTPGGAVCIVPVHSQHRGRLFLPFADDDPRTAEVLSKVILLARDEEIQDPIILDQLRRG